MQAVKAAAAQSVSDAYAQSGLKKETQSRLMKDNVALIVVLEALEGAAPPAPAGNRAAAARASRSSARRAKSNCVSPQAITESSSRVAGNTSRSIRPSRSQQARMRI